MEDVPQSSMSIGLVDRRNNSVLSSVPVADSDNPLILPPPDTAVWHYVRFDYFQKLLLNRTIWFTRLDKQSDKNSFIGDNPRSIALRSTVGHLLAAMHGQPVEARRQLYYPAEEPRPDWSYTAPFSAKDRSYARERELRLLTMIDDSPAEIPEYKLIPVDLKMMIRKVVIHPLGPAGFRKDVQVELASHGIQVSAARSRLRPCDLEAVASSHKH